MTTNPGLKRNHGDYDEMLKKFPRLFGRGIDNEYIATFGLSDDGKGIHLRVLQPAANNNSKTYHGVFYEAEIEQIVESCHFAIAGKDIPTNAATYTEFTNGLQNGFTDRRLSFKPAGDTGVFDVGIGEPNCHTTALFQMSQGIVEGLVSFPVSATGASFQAPATEGEDAVPPIRTQEDGVDVIHSNLARFHLMHQKDDERYKAEVGRIHELTALEGRTTHVAKQTMGEVRSLENRIAAARNVEEIMEERYKALVQAAGLSVEEADKLFEEEVPTQLSKDEQGDINLAQVSVGKLNEVGVSHFISKDGALRQWGGLVGIASDDPIFFTNLFTYLAGPHELDVLEPLGLTAEDVWRCLYRFAAMMNPNTSGTVSKGKTLGAVELACLRLHAFAYMCTDMSLAGQYHFTPSETFASLLVIVLRSFTAKIDSHHFLSQPQRMYNGQYAQAKYSLAKFFEFCESGFHRTYSLMNRLKGFVRDEVIKCTTDLCLQCCKADEKSQAEDTITFANVKGPASAPSTPASSTSTSSSTPLSSPRTSTQAEVMTDDASKERLGGTTSSQDVMEAALRLSHFSPYISPGLVATSYFPIGEAKEAVVLIKYKVLPLVNRVTDASQSTRLLTVVQSCLGEWAK